jgi:hypothetical protein
LNPNIWRIFTYNFTVRATWSALPVDEWRSLTAYLRNGDAQAFAFAIVAVSVLVIWHFFHSSRKDLFGLGLVLGAAALPFIAIRHIGWWPLLAAPALAMAMADLGAGFRSALSSRRGTVILVLVGCIFLIAAALRLPRTYYNPDTIPVPAADFLVRERLAGPFFNVYNHGGYLLWRLGPEEKVFIDGRSEVFAGQPVNDYLRVLRGEGLSELVDEKYHLNYFVLPYRPADTARFLAPLYGQLVQKGWALVWWDDAAIVLARPSPANSKVIGSYAIRHVAPWLDPRAIPPAERGAAAAELQSLLDRVPDSKILRIYGEEMLAAFRG